MIPSGTRQLVRQRLLSTLAFLCLACLGTPTSATERNVRDDLTAIFKEHGTTGTFVLYDVSADRMTLVNAERAQTRFVPASTFKIANSLIALETGVVKDENEVIPYGGKPQPFKQWERDMPIREAIVVSNVPVYQELARRIGLERYNQWLRRIGYGNGDPGSEVDRFWLDGPLKISAVEQAQFLASLVQRELDTSERAQKTVHDILRLKNGDGPALYGKTGWLFSRTPQLGWWVGWVERDNGIFTFALNMDILEKDDVKKRVPIGKALLAKLGVL